MKATFVGDPSQPKGAEQVPDSFEAHGLTFEKGKATEIPPELEAKFVGNNHFEVSGAAKSDEGKEAAKADAPVARTSSRRSAPRRSAPTPPAPTPPAPAPTEPAPPAGE